MEPLSEGFYFKMSLCKRLKPKGPNKSPCVYFLPSIQLMKI